MRPSSGCVTHWGSKPNIFEFSISHFLNHLLSTQLIYTSFVFLLSATLASSHLLSQFHSFMVDVCLAAIIQPRPNLLKEKFELFTGKFFCREQFSIKSFKLVLRVTGLYVRDQTRTPNGPQQEAGTKAQGFMATQRSRFAEKPDAFSKLRANSHSKNKKGWKVRRVEPT